MALPAAAKPPARPRTHAHATRSQRGGQRQRSQRLARELRRRRDHRRIEGDGDGRGHPRPRAGDERGKREGGADRERADHRLGLARGAGVDAACDGVAAQRVGEGEEGRRPGRPVQRMGHARAAVVAGRAQVAGQSHVRALVGRGVTGPVAGGLHPQDRRGDDHRPPARRATTTPRPGGGSRANDGVRRLAAVTGAPCRMAATVERELPCAGRTVRSWRSRRPRRTARPHRRAMSRIVERPRRVGVAEHGLDQEQPRPRRSARTCGPRTAAKRAASQARQRVAPVHDAGVGHPPQRRRVAHARRQLVRELGHLLGLGGEDERAARQRRRELAGDLRDVALVLERRDRRTRVPGEERRREHRQRSQEREAPEPERDEQRQRREHDDQVAQRPCGRPEARVGEGGEQRRRRDDGHAQHARGAHAVRRAAPRSRAPPRRRAGARARRAARSTSEPRHGSATGRSGGATTARRCGRPGRAGSAPTARRAARRRRRPARRRGPTCAERARPRAGPATPGPPRRRGTRPTDGRRGPAPGAIAKLAQMRAAPQDEGAQERAADQERDQQQQRVHPRLVGVQADEGIERHERRRRRGRPTPRRRDRPPGGRHARDGQARRQRVRRARGRAEERHPHVQEQVVERRRAVLAQKRRGSRQRVRRDPDRDALVDPVRRQSARRRSTAARPTSARTAAATRTRRPDGRARGARSQNAGEAEAATTVMRLSFPTAPGRIRPRSEPVCEITSTDLPRFAADDHAAAPRTARDRRARAHRRARCGPRRDLRQSGPARRPSRPDRRARRGRLLRERDERIVGADLPHLPARPTSSAGARSGPSWRRRRAWAAGNFWAPELVRWSGRMLAFYSASRRGGPPCLGVASAPRPEGPWRDRGPVLCRPGGVIDVDPFTDADGARWLLFKRLGSGHGIYAMRFSERRLRAVGHAHELIAPDAAGSRASPRARPWCAAAAPTCSSTPAGTAAARRAPTPRAWRAPRRCSAPTSRTRPTRCWSATRPGSAPGTARRSTSEPPASTCCTTPTAPTTPSTAGAPALLDRVDFTPDGWPTIAGGLGPALTAARPWAAPARAGPPGFTDRFAAGALAPGWEWPFFAVPDARPDRGALRLTCRGARRPSFLARQVPVDRFTALATVAAPRGHGPAIGVAAQGPGRSCGGSSCATDACAPSAPTTGG